MKSRRKIWSLPLALVTALLLVGMLGASVLAQQADPPSLANNNIRIALNGDATVTGDLATITVEDQGSAAIVAPVAAVPDDPNTPANEARPAFVNPAIIGGPTFVFDNNTPNDTTDDVRGPLFAIGGSLAAGYTISLGANADNDDLTADSYSFQVRIILDEDGQESTDDVDTVLERDITLTANVTVNVLNVDVNALQFDVVPAKAVKGATVSGVGNPIGTDPLEWDLSGIGSHMKLISIGAADDDDPLVGEVGDFVVKEYPAGSGKFRLFVENSDAAALSGTQAIDLALAYDQDTAVNTNAPVNPADVQDAEDTDPADDPDRTINITGTITQRTALVLTGGNIDGTTGNLATDEENHYEFTIPSSITANTPVGAFGVANGIPAIEDNTGTTEVDESRDAEYLDGIVSGSMSTPFNVRDADMTLVYDGDPSLSVGTYTFDLTVSGDAGLANRTVIGKVQVTVTASNEAPTAPSSFSETVAENVESEEVVADANATPPITAADEVAGLVSPGTAVGDASTGVDARDGDSLAYSLHGAGAGVFSIGASTGIITVGDDGISDSSVKPGTGLEQDNSSTADVDETVAVYIRGDNGKFGSASESLDKYADVTYTFRIKVADGVSANDKYIDATVIVDVNEPTEVVADDDLPSGVMTATLMIDDDGDDETDLVEVDGYQIAVSVPERDVPMTVVNLGEMVTDADSDDLTFSVTGAPSHLVYDSATDNILLTYLPPEADPGPRVDMITIGVSDGFNGEDTNDQTIYIEVSVTEEPPAPITSNFVSITVAENGTDCSQENVASGCSVAGIVTGATTYSVESGVDGGDTNYAVANDGTITVLTAPNFEDGLNPAFLVNANNAEGLAGLISVRVSVTDVPEAPELADFAGGTPWVYETAQIGDAVVLKPASQDGPAATDLPISISATDQDDGATITYTISSTDAVPFAVDSSSGALTVSGALDRETDSTHAFTVRATDEDNLYDEMDVTVHVLNANEAPIFTSPTGDGAVTTIPENTPNSVVIFTFTATDEDEDDLEFNLREGQSRDLFVIEGAGSNMVNGVEVWSGELHVKTGVTLDYEDAGYDPRVHVEANDPEGLNATLLLTVNLSNVNDNEPAFDNTPATQLSVAENTVRGTTLSNYSATDADGDTVTYSLRGGDAGSFSIDGYGNLMTLESLDADRQVPCGSDGCAVEVVASDGTLTATANVRITVTAVEDSVSTLDVSKANPVPGTEMGNPMSALSNAKDGGYEYLWNQLDCAGMLDLVGASDNAVNRAAYCHMWDGMTDANQKKVRDTYIAMGVSAPAESPYDLPATYGSSPMNFVETEWANWGTVLRIEVTAEAPDASCGNGNQCVVVNVNSDSADDSIKLEAYRVDTPAGSASRENHYVAALMLVELSSDATPGDNPVFSGVGGGVAALKVDEEDEVEVEFGNLRDTIDVENEAPEVSNFAPEHERAFDDPDVDYTFTITDDNSGLSEPEDLPDNDGDADYTPVVALISKSEGGVGQCSVAETAPKGTDNVLNFAAHIHEDDTLYCPGREQEGEYVASEGGFGFAPIRDDKDFDEIDNGYDVETTIVLTENDTYYVTFIVCDRAGNCAYHDPDGNDDDEELAEITVDTLDPVFVEARTGLNWDSTDNEYDDNRNYIQVIFNDLTTLNAATVEVDDFVVEGHTIESVSVYENPDDDDVNWGDSGRYAEEGSRNLRHIDRYRDLENAVFIELADELLADETPDVTIVPNGVEDGAGNEQDDGDHEADDWISPKFTVVSITSTLETAQDDVLAGDGDEITLVVTADERLDATRPTVVVTYVNAPSGSVDTKGVATCDTSAGADKGTRDRGEIVTTDDCQDSSAAKGGTLNNSVEKVSNTEWIVTVTEPKDTGYYSFRISGVDRSPQENPGSEGIAADSIVTDFFDSDGDVNTDDAVFWEGDINLANPNVRVSGNVITDNEPDIEYRSPLFVEIDFTANHWSYVDCRGEDDNDNLAANCMNENSEYAEDNFDDIVITMFELDGVDMTDSVKTTDDQTFLVTLENVALGDHTARIQAMDVAGNTLEDVLEIDFEVSDRDPFERRLNPGWNLVSLPGEPADSSIGSVFGPGVEVRTVYTYDPVVPGGWMVAVRETLDSDWQGDLTEVTGTRGYWVLSDAIQDWEVSIPRLAGGAAGTGTPIQPPVIALYAGWNLIPVTDISGNGEGGQTVSADVYLQNLDDGLDLARVLGFDTIRNQWVTVLDPDMQMNNTLTVGSGYWIFVREAASLVPSGYVSGGGSD